MRVRARYVSIENEKPQKLNSHRYYHVYKDVLNSTLRILFYTQDFKTAYLRLFETLHLKNIF